MSSIRQDTTTLQPHEEQNRIAQLFSEHSKPAETFQRYEKTFVLMLYWEDSDMDTGPEINDLAKVFEHEYKFEVEKFGIAKGKDAQIEVNYAVIKFVRDHQDGRTLLIIYYAGHGKMLKQEERKHVFKLAGRSDSEAQQLPKIHMATWTEAEMHLHNPRDVLAIFDCCYAGALCHTRDVPASRFEYLGACSENQRTKMPGPDSFTRALIWALLQLKDGPPFTTQRLCGKIREYSDFPKEQMPTTGDPRKQGPKDLIMICPMDRPLSGAASMMEESPSHSLDLRFFFSQEIEDDMIKLLAKKLRAMISDDQDLWVEYISCLGKDIPVEKMKNVVEIWKGVVQLNKLSKTQPGSISISTSQHKSAMTLAESPDSLIPTIKIPAGTLCVCDGQTDLTPVSEVSTMSLQQSNRPMASKRQARYRGILLRVWVVTCLVLFFSLIGSLYFNLKLIDILFTSL